MNGLSLVSGNAGWSVMLGGGRLWGYYLLTKFVCNFSEILSRMSGRKMMCVCGNFIPNVFFNFHQYC